MPVDPFFLRKLTLVEGISSYEEAHFDPEKARRLEEFEASDDPWDVPAEVIIREERVPGPHGDIPVRIYESSRGSARCPGLLWMHGGGYVGGDLDMAEAHTVSAEIAARAGATVISVDYRLAVNGVAYPVPLDDVIAAWVWLVENRDNLNIDGKLFIGGGSAGAGLAGGAALRLRDEGMHQPDGLLLAYPGPHFPLPPLSPETYEEMRSLPKLARLEYPSVLELQKNYAGRLHDVPKYSHPGNATLTGLPAVSIIICEYDDLRSSGELFVIQLQEAGVPVRSHFAAGMLHGHLNRHPGPTLPEVSASIDFFVDAIQDTHNSVAADASVIG